MQHLFNWIVQFDILSTRALNILKSSLSLWLLLVTGYITPILCRGHLQVISYNSAISACERAWQWTFALQLFVQLRKVPFAASARAKGKRRCAELGWLVGPWPWDLVAALNFSRWQNCYRKSMNISTDQMCFLDFGCHFSLWIFLTRWMVADWPNSFASLLVVPTSSRTNMCFRCQNIFRQIIFSSTGLQARACCDTPKIEAWSWRGSQTLNIPRCLANGSNHFRGHFEPSVTPYMFEDNLSFLFLSSQRVSYWFLTGNPLWTIHFCGFPLPGEHLKLTFTMVIGCHRG